jgi:hypothetical protein
MGAEVGGSDPAAEHDSDMWLHGVDAQADKGTPRGITHGLSHPARPSFFPLTSHSHR